MVTKQTLILAIVLLLFGSTLSLAQDEEDLGDLVEYSQWASSAEATSEYTSDGWSAMQATGEPDTTVCEDVPTAWASESSTGKDSLTLYYDVPVFPTQVNIYQTLNPGAITSIEVIPADGSDPISVPKSADQGTDCPGVFSFDFNEDFTLENPPIIGVIINLDQSITGDWNEIDAVELVGLTFEALIDDANASAGDSGGKGSTRDPNTPLGLSVTCDSGQSFTNGIEVVVIQMRTGFTYTATAVGLNGFDPVLAVLGESGSGLCADDDFAAAEYSVDLPTTGYVEPSGLSSQVRFSNNYNSSFADISLVVGGFGDSAGEFVLILEGMALTSADGIGDPFAVRITPGMVDSGVPLTTYMISVTNSFDPMIAVVDSNYDIVQLDDGSQVYCDDAGNSSLCFGESAPLGNSYVSRTDGRYLPGGQLDSMLTIPLAEALIDNYITYVMRSPGMETYGDYVVGFHMGIAGN